MDPAVTALVTQVLHDTMQQPAAQQHFNHPVDTVQYPDYHLLVKEPADLGSIAARLARGGFSSPSEVAAAVARVWTACRTYNDPASDIVRLAGALEAAFAQAWARTGLPHSMATYVAGGGPGPPGPAGASSPAGAAGGAPRPGPPPARRAAPGKSAGSRAGHPLQRCLTVVEAALERAPASAGLAAIRDRLAPGQRNGWGTVEYKSTAEVLRDLRAASAGPDQPAVVAAWAAEGLGAWAPAPGPTAQGQEAPALGSPTVPSPHSGSEAGPWSAFGAADATTAAPIEADGPPAPPPAHTDSLRTGSLTSSLDLSGVKPGAPGHRGRGKGRAQSLSRCEVCVRQKRGNCGTPLAHKGCLLRPATAAASGSPRTPGGEGLPAPLRNPLSSLKPGKKGRGAGVNAKVLAKEREAMAAARTLQRKREAAAEAALQLREAIALEQEARKFWEEVAEVHARLRQPPETSTQDEAWSPGARFVPATYTADHAAALQPRWDALREAGAYWAHRCAWQPRPCAA
uniref:Bromo domain-containing protein n=1 Tax=Auxenochlorella protothecoides TaxID=3075 RepID=A0A1D1ZZN1_AUXPR